MKTIKVWNVNNYYDIIDNLSKKFNFDYTIIEDPYLQEADICILSMGNFMLDHIQFESIIYRLKGNPKIIIYSGESASNGDHMTPNKINTISFYQQDRYTLSHNIDSNQNCYCPYILTTNWDETQIDRKVNINHNKTKFCNFVSSNPSIERELLFNYISKNYKVIDSYGKAYHNTPKDCYEDYELDDIIPSYKFSLVVENELSFDNEIYLSEKIIRAFKWGTIPIYWGSINMNKIINENAFINITGLSLEKAITLIKKYDEDDNLYNEMQNQPIFKIDKDKLLKNEENFIKHIIFDDKEIQLIHKTYNIGILGFDKSYFSEILQNNHHKFNLTSKVNKFKNCDLIICNNIDTCNKLINDYKLKTLFVCYNNEYDCGYNNIKQNLFTISEQYYNTHNLFIPYKFFTIRDIDKFNMFCHENECIEPLKYYNDFDYYTYYRKTIIYFIVDIIENNMSRKNTFNKI